MDMDRHRGICNKPLSALATRRTLRPQAGVQAFSQSHRLQRAKMATRQSCAAARRSHLDEAVDAAGDQQLAVRREGRHLRVALLAELDAAVQRRRVRLHLVALPLRLAPEQVERRARRQQALVLLPAHGGSHRALRQGRPCMLPDRPPAPALRSCRKGMQRQTRINSISTPKIAATLLKLAVSLLPHDKAAHHFRACPMSAMSRDGGTIVTSEDSACAICARRLSFGIAPYTSLRSCS